MKQLKTHTNTNNGSTSTYTPGLQNPNNDEPNEFSDDIDSSCSTPYVSAPSSPGRVPPLAAAFFYSAPASPIHFVLSSTHSSQSATASQSSVFSSLDFEFSAKAPATGSVPADELFLNGQIRPMKLSPLLDLDETEPDCDESEEIGRGRDAMARDRSLRRRTRSMSPLRSNSSRQWYKIDDSDNQIDLKQSEVKMTTTETPPAMSDSSSRSSSAGRSSKRWVFLKELLYRSKSEGRNENDNHNLNHNKKFWPSISFSPIKDRKLASATQSQDSMGSSPVKVNRKGLAGKAGKKGGSWRSAHEMHYAANRAQAEEMKRKTYLPYRQGLFGCLGLSSKSYGVVNGFVGRALNPVPSR